MTRRLAGPAAALTLAVALAGCGGGGGDEVSNPLSDNDLTQAEIEAVAAAVQGAASQGTSSAGPTALQRHLVLDERGVAASGNIPLNGQYACQVGGRISWTGNVAWSANETTGAWTMGGGIMFQVSDPTNNLNDCQVAPGVILDGTLNFVVAGTSAEGVGSTLNGEISVNRRGPTGGLVPRGSCWIMLTVPRGGSRATGSVCGHSVS
jgi:hypothetical protein